MDFVLQKIEDIEIRGSGFSLSEIKELNIQVSRFEPCPGSSYIDLPKFLKLKHAIINVKNRDNECFKWAVLSGLFPAGNHCERVSKYKQYESLLNFSGISFPVDLKGISKFEKQNPNISVNVYMFEQKESKVRSLRLTKEIKMHHIHLLMLTKQTDETK